MPTSDETKAERLQSAVDRQRECQTINDTLRIYEFGSDPHAQGRLDADRVNIVDAYLAKYPADDDEPATAEWLLSLPEAQSSSGSKGYASIIIGAYAIHRWRGEWSINHVEEGAMPLPANPTKKRIRQLIAALGE